MDEDIQVYKKDRKRRMVCPVCEELEIKSCLFPIEGTREEDHPFISFFDEDGHCHSHSSGGTQYFQCSNGHIIAKRYEPQECITCMEQRNPFGSFEINQEWVLYPVTDQVKLNKLAGVRHWKGGGYVEHDTEEMVNEKGH